MNSNYVSLPEHERAMARMDALSRTVVAASRNIPPSLFQSPEIPYPRHLPPPTCHPSRSGHVSLSKFNTPQATQNWPNMMAYGSGQYRERPSPASSNGSADERRPPIAHSSRSSCSNSRATNGLEGYLQNVDLSSSSGSSHSSNSPRQSPEMRTASYTIPTSQQQQYGSDYPGSPNSGSSSNSSQNDLEWLQYAGRYLDDKSQTQWKCHWGLAQGTGEPPCNYWGKKQLVKRHVEGKHMQLKPYVCLFAGCGGAFTQRGMLKIHMSSAHQILDQKECPYCDKLFIDPARLHRHKIESHGYVPKHIVRKKDMKEVDLTRMP